MTYQRALLEFFRQQKQGLIPDPHSLMKFTPITLTGFCILELRRYPSFEGRRPDGALETVPPRFAVHIASTKEFAARLNGDARPVAISVTGIDLPEELSQQLVKDAEKCRADLLSGKPSLLPGLSELRITKKDNGRKVLTSSLNASRDEEIPDRSPLLIKFEAEINKD